MQKKIQAFSLRRILPYTLACVAVLIAIAIAKVQITEPKRVPLKQQLRWYANETKKQNKKVVTVPPWQALYAEPDLDEVTRRFTVMVVQPVAKQTYENANGNLLFTWNKLRILETVSSPKEAVTDTSQVPPNELFPLNRGEILVQTSGGTKLIDGIEVSQPGPELKEDERYLIYVLLNPSGVGILAHGETGISAVRDNGQLVPFKKGFEQGDSLEALKSKLQMRQRGGR
jgi:hypothetical protein